MSLFSQQVPCTETSWQPFLFTKLHSQRSVCDLYEHCDCSHCAKGWFSTVNWANLLRHPGLALTDNPGGVCCASRLMFYVFSHGPLHPIQAQATLVRYEKSLLLPVCFTSDLLTLHLGTGEVYGLYKYVGAESWLSWVYREIDRGTCRTALWHRLL